MAVTKVDTAPGAHVIHLKSTNGRSIPEHNATVVVRTRNGDRTFTVAIRGFTCTVTNPDLRAVYTIKKAEVPAGETQGFTFSMTPSSSSGTSTPSFGLADGQSKAVGILPFGGPTRWRRPRTRTSRSRSTVGTMRPGRWSTRVDPDVDVHARTRDAGDVHGHEHTEPDSVVPDGEEVDHAGGVAGCVLVRRQADRYRGGLLFADRRAIAEA